MLQIIYDSREGSGTTENFAIKLASTLGIRAYNVNQSEYITGDFILCTYTYGLGEIPKTTMDFLNRGNNKDYIKGVVSNGSSNFKAMGLFAISGDRIRDTYNVPLYKKLDMGGTNEDIYEVASRINYDFKLNLELDKKDFVPESTFINGKFTFKQRGTVNKSNERKKIKLLG